VVRVVVVSVIVVQTKNFLNPDGLGSGTRGSGVRGSGTTQNFQSPAARDSGMNAKFSKSSRAW